MRKLVSFMTALVVSCTLAISAWAATEVQTGTAQPYDGIYEPDPEYSDAPSILVAGSYFPDNMTKEADDVKVVADQGRITLYFVAAGVPYEIEMEQTRILEGNQIGSLYITSQNEWSASNTFYYRTENGKEYLGNGVVNGPKAWIELHHLIKTGDVKPAEPVEVSHSFMHQIATDSGQYEMYLSGFLTMDLVSGENILTNAEIQAQSISIHVKNTQNGVTRVMTQSTIEGLTIRVSQGGIKELTINGRVQTSGGTLERYTTVISF